MKLAILFLYLALYYIEFMSIWAVLQWILHIWVSLWFAFLYYWSKIRCFKKIYLSWRPFFEISSPEISWAWSKSLIYARIHRNFPLTQQISVIREGIIDFVSFLIMRVYFRRSIFHYKRSWSIINFRRFFFFFIFLLNQTNLSFLSAISVE